MTARLYRRGLTLTFAGVLMVGTGSTCGASGQKTVTLNIRKILGGKQVCTIPSSAQFLSEDALVLLVGPDSDCYRSMNDLELVVVSTSGLIIACKPEPSTFPTVILPGARIAVTELNRVTVLNSHLQIIQTIILPLPSNPTSFYPRRIGTDLLAVRDARGPVYIYRGDPLQLVSNDPKDVASLFRAFTLQDGQTIKLTYKSLIDTNAKGQDHVVATLSWVNPCDKSCQAYDAGFDFSVATEGMKRVLATSNGSRFPVTDAAGLFPYFRIEVFNLRDGTSVYHEQFVTKTGHRTADISPAGDLLVLNDGSHLELKHLN